MNRAVVDRIANALLYEGYLLYPYRPSIKNRQRWTFGGLYPPSYAEARGGSDASAMQTQCLVRGGSHTRLSVMVRFLQLVARRVGEFDSPLDDWPVDELPPVRHVASLRVGEAVLHSWQEAVEREIVLGEIALGEIADQPRRVDFRFDPGCELEPLRAPDKTGSGTLNSKVPAPFLSGALRDAGGRIVGLIERERRRIDGAADLSALAVAEGIYRVTVRVENRTPFATDDRDEALLQSLVSTHTLLGVEHGDFLSLLDPPEPWRELAAGCRNVGTWPVLVGAEGETDTLLSSPIILYDYPQVAPESPGDLFDATEIDEILTLRIMTMTDEEKRSMAALDDRGRALLERTEALAREQLLGLHGTVRELRPIAKGPNHGE